MRCIRPIEVNQNEVACGSCIACRITRREAWTIRLMHESFYHDYTSWTTITYDDEHYGGTLIPYDIETWLKRLRKALNRPKDKGIRFALSGEYGDEKDRAHYHVLLYGLKPDSYADEIIRDTWRFGKIIDKPEPALYERYRYLAGYIVKKLVGDFGQKYYESKNQFPPFMRMSRMPGIGLRKNDVIKSMPVWLRNGCIHYQGKIFSIPKFYLNMDDDYKAIYKANIYKENNFKKDGDIHDLTYAEAAEVLDLRREQKEKNALWLPQNKRSVL